MAGAALLVACVVAGCGLMRVQFTDDYRGIFRTDRNDFALLEEISAQFGSDESEVVVLAKHDDLFHPDVVAQMRTLTTTFQAIPGVESVQSPVTASGLPELLAKTDDPQMRASIREALEVHPLLRSVLISDDMDAALIVVRISEALDDLAHVEPVLGAIDTAIHESSVPGLSLTRAGVAFVRSEIVRSVQLDQAVFMSVGVVLGALIAIMAFRDMRLALLVAVAPVTAAAWIVGAMGWLGEPINVLNNVVPVLVMVIGMTDSVHFVREYRALTIEGRPDQHYAAVDAARSVSVPCALTTLTTMMGFSSLALAEFGVIRRFGLTCAGGLALSLVTVLTVTPLLAGWTPLGRIGRAARKPVSPRPPELVASLKRFSKLIVASSIVLVGLAVYAAWGLRPDFRYREFLREDSMARYGLAAVEAEFDGSYPVRIVVDWPKGADEQSVLAMIAAVEAAAGSWEFGGRPFSVLSLLRTVVGGNATVENLPEVGNLPADARDRFWNREARRAIVEMRVPELGAAELEPKLLELEETLAQVTHQLPGCEVTVNGLLPVTARTSLRMIGSLVKSLGVAAVFIFTTLAIATRSLRLGLVSILPNLLPLGAICLFLAFSGRPLQFTSVTVLTIVLGLAVDDTIHVLAWFQRLCRHGVDIETAIWKTYDSVGRSLVVTTALLVAGFGAVGLSRAPLMSLFGWLSAGALIVALITVFVLLPSLLRLVFARRLPAEISDP